MALILAGAVVAPILSRQVLAAPTYAAKLLFALLTDGLRAGAFMGVALIIIGLLRNRRWKREDAQAP